MLKTIGKVLLFVIAGFLGLLVVGLLVALLFYPPEYVYRMVAWGNSDYFDYLNNFPSRPLNRAPATFYFDEAPDEGHVAKVFETILNNEDFDEFLEEMDTQAFIVIQDDAILYEKYFNGYERDTMLTSFSVAKSFTSALIGIAIEEGYIDGIDDPITDYLPELADRDARFRDITIRHLLMMAGGLDFQEMRPGLFNGDDPLTSYYPDQREAALKYTNVVDPPGEYFLYNKYHPQLLGLILERATGTSITGYLQEKLWDANGMEFDGSWSLDSQASGFEKMEAGLNARAIDFAKFGRLYLEKGNWGGEQVIPADWVTDSTTVDASTHHTSYYPDEFGQTIFETLHGYYKYMWYGYLRDGEEYDFAAEGDHGQIIYVSPHKNLIIVRNGEEYGRDWGMAKWMDMIYQFASDF